MRVIWVQNMLVFVVWFLLSWKKKVWHWEHSWIQSLCIKWAEPKHFFFFFFRKTWCILKEKESQHCFVYCYRIYLESIIQDRSPRDKLHLTFIIHAYIPTWPFAVFFLFGDNVSPCVWRQQHACRQHRRCQVSYLSRDTVALQMWTSVWPGYPSLFLSPLSNKYPKTARSNTTACSKNNTIKHEI